jgi:SPP1 family predicted phage head-tail adaptor
MAFSAGLNKLVVLQTCTQGKDAAGGATKVWADFDEVWAGIRNLSGEEKRSTAHGGQAAIARTEITIRYHPDVNERMRVVYNGAYYNIRHVNNWNEQNWKMILTCDTGTALAD